MQQIVVLLHPTYSEKHSKLLPLPPKNTNLNQTCTGFVKKQDETPANGYPIFDYFPQHFLYFRPLPQVHGSLRPVLLTLSGFALTMVPSVNNQRPCFFLNWPRS